MAPYFYCSKLPRWIRPLIPGIKKAIQQAQQRKRRHAKERHVS